MPRSLVIADDRERSSEIPSLLGRLPGVELRVARLSLGDYLVENSVLIDSRLFAQASMPASSQFRTALIIQSGAKEWNALGVRREALQGALVTLMLIFDIPVFRAANAEECARLILYTGQQLARLRDPNHAPYRMAKAKRRRTRQLRLPQTLPGVVPERAALLLEHFTTIQACLNAPVEELQKIEGIGPKTAEAIYNTLREMPPVYGSAADADSPLW